MRWLPSGTYLGRIQIDGVVFEEENVIRGRQRVADETELCVRVSVALAVGGA